MSNVATTAPAPGLVMRFAERYGVEPEKMLHTLKQTAFRAGGATITNEQMMALLIVAERHQLDPFTKEIYAYPDKGGGIVPVVGVDGWVNIAQSHPQFDGWAFEYDSKEQAAACTIWRKDRSHPTRVVEYVVECKRDTDPWKRSPRRMIRNRSIAQCVRLAFGFAGIHDDDEAQLIAQGEATSANTTANRVREVLRAAPPAPDPVPMVEEVTDNEQTVPGGLALADYLDDMGKAPTIDDAIEILDVARTGLVSDSEYQVLVEAYRSRFVTGEEGTK